MISSGRALAIVIGAVLGWSVWSAGSTSPCIGQVANRPTRTAAFGSASAPSAGVLPRPIDQIRVGERVLADNPEFDGFVPGQIEQDETKFGEPSTHKESSAGSVDDKRLWWVVRLRMRKSVEVPDHPQQESLLEVELLRPTIWLAEAAAIPGQSIELDLPELGAAGVAEVLSVEAAPTPQPGRGRLVTGTFAHSATNVVDVTIAGLDAPIGCTANHPFWSHDRQEFVTAGELRIGEQLLTADGGLTSVVSVTPRNSNECVYNLEVDGEHVYYVSADGVLVHNSCSALRQELTRGLSDSDIAGKDAHHLVAQGIFSKRIKQVQDAVSKSRDILDNWGIGLHSSQNGLLVNRVAHRHLHTDKYLLEVYNRLSKANLAGADAVSAALLSIKSDILNGTLIP